MALLCILDLLVNEMLVFNMLIDVMASTEVHTCTEMCVAVNKMFMDDTVGVYCFIRSFDILTYYRELRRDRQAERETERD